MHLLSNSQPIDLGKPLGLLQPGEWLMHDLNAFEIACRAPRGTVTVKDHGWEEKLGKDMGHTLLMRSGAIGDLLMLSPAIFEWKLTSNRTLTLSCFSHHWPIFNDVSRGPFDTVAYPFPLSGLGDYDEIISLENTMETNHEEHATDVFAKAMGLKTPLESYKPIYEVADSEKAATAKWLFANRPNVAIQPRASIPNRDYPAQLWLQVIMGLEKRGWGVLLLGKKGQIPPFPPEMNSPFIRNLAEEDLSLRESVAVLSQCNAFCGVDSSFSHFAGALDIPSVTLSAAFDWHTRTMHYPHNTALAGVGACAPCNWHMHNGRMFPPDKPCTTRGLCVVLADIKPERIVAKLELLKP